MIHRISNNSGWGTRGRLIAALVGILFLLGTAAAVQAAGAPDFGLSITPSSQTINSGSSASYTVSVAPSNGFTGAVTLTAGSLPSGMSASWVVGGSTTAGSSATLTVPAGSQGLAATLTISGGQPKAATYTPTVTAKSGSLSHVASATLVVLAQNAANFGVSVSPPSQTLAQGGSTSSTISISRSNWTGSVSLGPVSGLPSGATATLNPASTTGSSAALTISASSSVPAGFYIINVGASAVLSGNATSTRSAAITLVVQNATSTTAAAPAADATNAAIPAASISSALANATSGATGMVTFRVFGPQATAPSTCNTGGTTVGTATVNGSGTYHPSAGYTPSTAGTYWWYASYGGDAYNNASASTCGSGMASTLVKNTTAATATAPSGGAATAAIPAASISSALTGATSGASGTETFKVFGPQATAPPSCTTGGTTVGTATVNGTATYHPASGYTPAVGGTYWWYASYSGDTLNSPATSACGAGMASTTIQDFSIAASPSGQTTLTSGTSDDTASYTTTVAPIGGYAGSVALTVSGLPAGATPSFSPATTSSSSTLSIDVGPNVTAGTYPLSIQGTATISGTTVTRTTPVTLVVQTAQQLTISGDVPSPLYPGAPAQSFPVTITNPNSFSVHVTSLGSVGIRAPGAPSCDSNWFWVTLPAVASTGIAVSGNGGTATVTATARMLDVNASQDACKGQKLALTYTGTYGK